MRFADVAAIYTGTASWKYSRRCYRRRFGTGVALRFGSGTSVESARGNGYRFDGTFQAKQFAGGTL